MKFLFVLVAIFIAAVNANYGVETHHHQAHSYHAHPPKVECGSNLLAGCVPVVAHVPCHPVHHGYGHGGHHYEHKHEHKHEQKY